MKRIPLSLCSVLLLLAVGFCPASAREYRPMLKDGKMWKHQYFTGGQKRGEWYCEIKGDTIIDNQKCFKLYETFVAAYGDTISSSYSGALYEEGQKVYCISDTSEKREIYDFNQGVGFSEYIDSFDKRRECVSSGEVLVLGRSYFYLKFITSFTDYTQRGEVSGVYEGEEYFIEGIGCDLYFLDSSPFKYPMTLLSCYEDGECVFSMEEFLRAVESLETVHIHQTPGDADSRVTTAYDLQGRRVTSNQPRSGIYVREGRKFVVK